MSMTGNIIIHGGGAMKGDQGIATENSIIERIASDGRQKKITMLNLGKFPEARQEYLRKFQLYYENLSKYYNLQIDHILDPKGLEFGELDDILGNTDLLYIGGGRPTLLQENLTTDLVGKILNHNKSGMHIVGRSAGGILFGHNYFAKLDDPYEYNGVNYNAGDNLFLPGLNLISGNFIAHFSNRNRQQFLEDQIKYNNSNGYGLDEYSALILTDDSYEALNYNTKHGDISQSNVHKYSLDPISKQKVIKEIISSGDINEFLD